MIEPPAGNQQDPHRDVTGSSSGEALTRAAASVVDDLADRLRRGPRGR